VDEGAAGDGAAPEVAVTVTRVVAVTVGAATVTVARGSADSGVTFVELEDACEMDPTTRPMTRAPRATAGSTHRRAPPVPGG
jgi:hypothetical protein